MFALAGAGLELTFPGGDGYLAVITPSSPIGSVMIGRRVGDTVEVLLPDRQGETRQGTITFVE